jgi:pantoate--beta-alanine ligase
VNENTLSNTLCGEFRPGHFEGVLTVVMKLLNLTQAHRAYFGEKDHQQLMLIEGMVKAFFLKTEIIPCPIIREDSGLAMSSRNLRLSPEDAKIAPKLYEVISTEKDIETAKKKLESMGFKVEYLVDQLHAEQKRRYAAAWLSEVRLIDNVRI